MRYELGWCNPSVEHAGTQEMVMITWNDELATCDGYQVVNLEKEEREKQNQGDQGKGIR